MDVTADENVRDQVAEALLWCLNVHQGMDEDAAGQMADELLADVMPTVTRLLDAARAEGARTALHDAADWLSDLQYGGKAVLSGYGARRLRDRAAAIPTSSKEAA